MTDDGGRKERYDGMKTQRESDSSQQVPGRTINRVMTDNKIERAEQVQNKREHITGF